MQATILYQSTVDPNHYYHRYKDVPDGEYCTLLVHRTDDYGTPILNEEPLAVGGFYRKEATADEKKELLSRALLNYKEPKPVEHDETCWKNLWDEITFKLNRYD